MTHFIVHQSVNGFDVGLGVDQSQVTVYKLCKVFFPPVGPFLLAISHVTLEKIVKNRSIAKKGHRL
jgi:hypothetical protein